MKIYTNTGDRGRTGLFSGERVSKADRRVEAYGEVDELNSVLGALVSELSRDTLGEAVHEAAREVKAIQSHLFCIGAWLATTPDSTAFQELPVPDVEAVSMLEARIDGMEEQLSALGGFILPGGHICASWSHIARAVCRRAERRVVALHGPETGQENEGLSLAVKYLNRLSDYLFVLARYCNHLQGVRDVSWEP